MLKRIAYWYCVIYVKNKECIYLPELQALGECTTNDYETEAAKLFRHQDIRTFQPMNLREMMVKTKRYIRIHGGNPEEDFWDYNIIITHVEVEIGDRIVAL